MKLVTRNINKVIYLKKIIYMLISIQWSLGYQMSLKSNNSEFDQNIWVKNVSVIK